MREKAGRRNQGINEARTETKRERKIKKVSKKMNRKDIKEMEIDRKKPFFLSIFSGMVGLYESKNNAMQFENYLSGDQRITLGSIS